MSKIKITLGIGGIILFCVVAAVAILLQMDRDAKRAAQEMMITDPVEIAQIASGMADYQLPPNYEEAMVVKLEDTHVLYLFVTKDTPDNLSYPRISLVQFQPAQFHSATAARRKLRLPAGATVEAEDGTYEVIDEETVTIRDQAVVLTHLRWFTHEGVEYHSLVSDIFEGKEGFLQLLIEGDAQVWDENVMDAFMRSIR